jgi:outer membrane lipoprotein-sorting protein
MKISSWFALALGAALVAATAAFAQDAGKKLLDQSIAASGGEAALRKVKDVNAKYEMTVSAGGQKIKGTFEVFQILPGKVRMDIAIAGQVQRVVITEKLAYMQAMGQTQDMPAADAEKQRLDLAGTVIPGWAMLQVADRKLKVTAKPGGAQIAGKKVDLLERTDPDGGTGRALLDPASHLPLALESKDGKQTLSDYKAIGGLQIPHTVHTEAGPQIIDLKLLSVKLDTGLKPAMFEKEAAKKDAKK